MNTEKSNQNIFEIEANDVVFSYTSEEVILKGVGILVEKSKIVGILGPNGSGKTTFIKCLNRILTPSQGSILLNGEDLSTIKRKEISKNLGFVPQSHTNEMSSPNVYDVVMMGRRPYMKWQFTEEDEKLVWSIMKELDVAHLASHGFNDLSSGQTQRVLIGRAIAQQAKVFLLDEPTSNLDVKYQMEVMTLIKEIVREKNVSACAIVHDLDLAMRYCDNIVLMCEGEIVSSGTSQEVLTPENIKRVYGVDAIIENIHGRNRVIIL